MLAKIKSLRIFKLTFSFLEKKRKLSLVIYNKNIQNKLNINFMDYKLTSGKYFKKENDNYGKLFNINDFSYLIKEGQHINGKLNGYVKEYNEYGYLIYEGEYLNNKRNGKGKEFINGIKFEGEFLNGEKNGKCIEYYFNDKLKFEGEYLNNKKWNGRIYDFKNNNYYELKNGKGFFKEYDLCFDTTVFEGEYLNGEKNGKI